MGREQAGVVLRARGIGPIERRVRHAFRPALQRRVGRDVVGLDDRRRVQEAQGRQPPVGLDGEGLVRAARDLHRRAEGHSGEVHDDGVVAVGLHHRFGRLHGQDVRVRREDERDLAGEHPAGHDERRAAGLGQRQDRQTERGQDDRRRLGNLDRHRLGRRRRAHARGRAAPGDLRRLAGAVLVAVRDRDDAVHDDGVGAQVSDEQVIAGVRAPAEQAIAVRLELVVPGAANIDAALERGRDGTGVGLVVRDPVQPHPALARRLVVVAAHVGGGRDGQGDVGGDGLLGRRCTGDAGVAGEDGDRHDGDGREDGLGDAIQLGHGCAVSFGVALANGFPARVRQ